MKNHKTKLLLASMLAVGTIISTPFVSFAQSNDQNNYQTNNGNHRGAFVSFFARNQNSSKSNSIWNRMENWFTPQWAHASNDNNNDGNGTTIPVVKNQTPSISGITAPTVLKAGETGTWKVNASDPQNGSLTYAVNWGDQVAQPLAMMAEPIFTQTSSFTHAYTTAGTYTVTFTVSNSAGLKTTSTVTVHVTGTMAAAPVVSNVVATSTAPRQAKLTWTTDTKSSSLVWYGTTTPVDTAGTATVSHDGSILNHSITLTGLTPATKYYLVVGSANSAGTGMSAETSFTTPAVPDQTTPVITSLDGNKTVVAGATETVTINAYDPKNGSLTYKADWGDSGSMMRAAAETPFTQTASFSHIYDTAGTYTATFTASNEAGKTATSTMTIKVTAADTTGPVITGVKANDITATGSTVAWTTDEASTSRVYYSTTTPVDTSTASTVSSSTPSTDHSLVLSGLTSNTLYHFIVEAIDALGNKSVSSESSFTTSAQ